MDEIVVVIIRVNKKGLINRFILLPHFLFTCDKEYEYLDVIIRQPVLSVFFKIIFDDLGEEYWSDIL